MPQHYRFDEFFIIPLLSGASGAFASAIIISQKKPKRFIHSKTGVLALLLTFGIAYLLFLFNNNTVGNSYIHSFLKLLQSFKAGILLMVPGFILLTYLAEEKKPATDLQEGEPFDENKNEELE